jgi:tRNA (cmo5U34)-methyltransferase
MGSFSDPNHVARYSDGPRRRVPGFLDLQRMAMQLLAEQVPSNGEVLVLGAGGGLELKVMAEGQPGWSFLGIDPSSPMLALAKETLGPLASRVEFVEGYIYDAPVVRFDGATCLLTLHFLPADERLCTLKELKSRLKPGAPLVVAHHSFPQTPDGKERWLRRSAVFAQLSGEDLDVDKAVEAMDSHLPALSPEDDCALMREAGFVGVEMFYAALTFKGWLGYAS